MHAQQGFLDMRTYLHSQQIGKVTYSSFVLIGHEFPSPSLASFIHRESAVTL